MLLCYPFRVEKIPGGMRLRDVVTRRVAELYDCQLMLASCVGGGRKLMVAHLLHNMVEACFLPPN